MSRKTRRTKPAVRRPQETPEERQARRLRRKRMLAHMLRVGVTAFLATAERSERDRELAGAVTDAVGRWEEAHP